MLAVMLLVMQAECNQNGRYKFCLSVKCYPCDLQSKTTGTHATFFESNQTYKLDLIHIFFTSKQLQMFLNLNCLFIYRYSHFFRKKLTKPVTKRGSLSRQSGNFSCTGDFIGYNFEP